MSYPAFLTSFRREGGEVPCPVEFATRGARSAYLQYVEHPEARKHRWVGYIGARSRKLVRKAGYTLAVGSRRRRRRRATLYLVPGRPCILHPEPCIRVDGWAAGRYQPLIGRHSSTTSRSRTTL